MDHLTRLPLRGWRWLFGVLGVLLTGAAVYVFLDWPNIDGPKDTVMLIFPMLICLGGIWLLYVAFVANDEKLMRFVRFMQRFA